jgi:hypothetical protein
MSFVIQRHTSNVMGEFITIFEPSSGKIIPPDENNTDYQAYLAWVAEGNTAEEWNPQG